ncbi:hypothetical protein EDD11_001702 [Mortierella claussenii]|nr:hypothetical protein EDD11_001702 [Mortierella claussenii]
MMIPDAVICCNGALNYNPRTKTISYPQFIPLDQALFMVQHLRSTITAHGTRKSEIPLSKNPNEVGILGTDLQPLLQLTHDQSQEASQDQKNQKNDQEKTIDKNDPWIAGRVGFACEVIWYLGETGSGEPIYAQDTTFVCDKTWELQRKHSIYYEYTVVDDTMEVFINSLQPPPSATSDSVKQRMRPANKQLGRGGIVKLMALDRNRTAPQVYESLPDYLRPSTTATTATTTSPAELTPRVAVTYSGAYFLEISAAGVNKGLGLSKYCEAEGLAREDVVAFGDLLNDAEMLQFAGLGLCMGNGHEDMKRLADRIIGTNAEDGVAQEIESWFA